MKYLKKLVNSFNGKDIHIQLHNPLVCGVSEIYRKSNVVLDCGEIRIERGGICWFRIVIAAITSIKEVSKGKCYRIELEEGSSVCIDVRYVT